MCVCVLILQLTSKRVAVKTKLTCTILLSNLGFKSGKKTLSYTIMCFILIFFLTIIIT